MLDATALQTENAQLRERLQAAEHYTAQTLMRATRLAQVISVLSREAELGTTVERAAVEMADLFSADVALLMLGTDTGLVIEGHWGVRPGDLPGPGFVLPEGARLTASAPVLAGPVTDVTAPDWLAAYGAQHVAWARLMVGDESLGLMLLLRRADDPFLATDAQELRAIAYRIALAVENGLLQRRMHRRLEQLRRLQELTAELAGTLELEAVGRQLAAMLLAEVPVGACAIEVVRGGDVMTLATAGVAAASEPWERFPLEASGKPVGTVAVAGAPEPGSEARELLLHLVALAALALDKALLYEQSREQARSDSLTGLLGHRVFQEELESRLAHSEPFSVAVLDIDDFKQINDLHGHQVGDETLRQVADAVCRAVRTQDSIFRVGGEEFCAVLPGLGQEGASTVAERVRASVAAIVSSLPVTVSIGLASFPAHGRGRDELLAVADQALYASKRTGKNRVSIAGAAVSGAQVPSDREVRVGLLQDKDPQAVVHSAKVAILAVDAGRALGLASERLADLRLAAKHHDIGRIGVPQAVLAVPGPLDEAAWAIVRTHPVVGSELLAAWGLERPARFVLEHHEHVDGSGYPAGLVGDEITLEARIIHAAAAHVAMTHDRPHRSAMAPDEALAELVRHRGTQFDDDVVDALVALSAAELRAVV
jgi:diguanylate cyclase (GGDEF)-like protein